MKTIAKIPILLFLAAFSAPVIAQSPRIDSIFIDETKGVLMVHGEFSDSSSIALYVDTVRLSPTIYFPDKNLLIANIPDSGAGSCGPVKVVMNGKESNKRLISYWHIWVSALFRHVYSDVGMDESEESDSIHVRGDIETIGSLNLLSTKLSSFRTKADGNDGMHGYHYTGPTFDSLNKIMRTVSYNKNSGFYYSFNMPQSSNGGGDLNADITFDKDYQILSGSKVTCVEDGCGYSFATGCCFQWKALSATDFPPSNAQVYEPSSAQNILKARFSSNPATANAEIIVTLHDAINVRIQILDILGHLQYSDERMLPYGESHLLLAVSSLAAGVYICRIQAGNQVASVRFVKSE